MRIPVLTAAAGNRWESDLVAALEGSQYEIAVSRRCLDVVDLLAVAASGQGRAALIAAELRQLDTDAVDRLRASGIVAIGVGDPDGQARLRGLGVECFLAPDADPMTVSRVVLAAVSDRPEGFAGGERMFADPLAALPDRGAAPPGDDPPAGPSGTGRIVAVWGPAGAPGRTTVALGIADEIARLGSHALLIDADVYGGTVAALLGMLDESPGLAAACRLAGTSRLDSDGLAGLCWQLHPTFRVLTGIAFAQRWPDLRASSIPMVLATARRLADHVVVDCGFSLEADEEISFDSLAPRRNGATLAALDAADVVIAVGSADPIGMGRLVRGLADLRTAEIDTPVRVVLNRVRSSAVAGDLAGELSTVLQRFAGCEPYALLPYDLESLDDAVRNGRLLAEARPAGTLRRALVDLAAGLCGAAPPARHRRRAG